MNETSRMLLDTLERLLAAASTKEGIAAAEKGEWPRKLWDELEQAGVPLAAVPEDAGGVGLDWADAMLAVREAGRFAAPVPLAETMLANWLLCGAGLPAATGPATVAPVRADERLRIARDGEAWVLSGRVTRVPFARDAALLALVADGPDGEVVVALQGLDGVSVEHEANMAGEARDTLVFDRLRVAAGQVAAAGIPAAREALFARGALARSALMAGAAQRAFSFAVAYAGERVQFGKPIGKFQAVQQNLAVAAGQVAACGAATDLAVRAVAAGDGGRAPLASAIAKCRAGEAAGAVAAIAHQTHGAIGFTYEHALHQFTRRIWSWREEFGSEAYWSSKVGEQVLAADDDVWAFITAA